MCSLNRNYEINICPFRVFQVLKLLEHGGKNRTRG